MRDFRERYEHRSLLTLLLIVVWFGFLASAAAQGTAYYIAPSGSDSNPGTQSQPWSTFAHAIPLLEPGDTLNLLDGTYNSSNSGLPNINCSGGANNGTSSAPITIQSLNERQAFISGNGSGEAFNIVNCSYWNIVGLHVENADNASNTSSGDVMQFYRDTNLTIRRNLTARPNRCANTHDMVLYDTTNSLVQENEAYYFFRWGILVIADPGTNGGGNEIRRNYANRRNYADSSGVCTAYNNGGNSFGIGPYFANNNTFENNIVEQGSAPSQQDVGLNDEAAASSNSFFGNVAGVNLAVGYRIDPHSGYPQSTGNSYSNNVSVLPTQIGVWSRSTQSSWDHQSVFGNSTLEGMASDTDSCCSYSAYQFTVSNSAVQNFSSGTGYLVVNTASNTFSFDHDVSYNNAVAYSPSINIASPISSDPGFGNCVLWVPAASPLKGAGTGGSDIGANVLYEYNGGTLSNTPLWNSSTGAALFAGATVTGLNNVSGASLFDVQNRLNINTNGCSFPPSYTNVSGAPAPPSGLTATVQ